MGRPYSEDLRRRIVAAVEGGLSCSAAARQFAVSISTVTDYYKQNVYDPSDTKIGDIKDVLIDSAGQIKALIIGVGGLLGAGEKDVAVPFDAVKGTKKDNKWYLVMNANKDELKNAQGFTYDRSTTKWVPENK